MHPTLWKKYGNNARWFVSDWQINAAEAIRAYFGNKPMYLNNWFWGGPRRNRGTRLPNTTIGATYSQHKFKCAIDFNLKDITPQTIHNTILSHQQYFMGVGITTIEAIEDTPTWVHVDCRHTGLDSILIVNG
mgnify:CR=1 FL=1